MCWISPAFSTSSRRGVRETEREFRNHQRHHVRESAFSKSKRRGRRRLGLSAEQGRNGEPAFRWGGRPTGGARGSGADDAGRCDGSRAVVGARDQGRERYGQPATKRL